MKHFRVFVDKSLSQLRNTALNEYRHTGQFTDLTLQSTDNQTMRVHKNVLSASCSYFRAMFNSDNIESRLDTIKLKDNITMKDLEIIVEYLYIGRAQIEYDNAKNLYIKSQFLQLTDLKDFCSLMLLKKITLENCLELWRFSEQYFNDALKDSCHKFCIENAEIFLEKYLPDVTFEELKVIGTGKDLTLAQENLYKFLIKWVKAKFETREVYLGEILNLIDFKLISDEFFELEIISEKMLETNIQFATMMRNIVFQKFTETKSMLKNISKTRNSIGLPITLNLLSNDAIFELNMDEQKWVKKFQFEMKRHHKFTSATYKENIFFSGGSKGTKSFNNFKAYNKTNSRMRTFPSMLEKRSRHRLIYLNGNIYCCGAFENDEGSMEMFDVNTLKWSIGASMNKVRDSFGIVATDQVIYVCGGFNDESCNPGKIVERYDPRLADWEVLSKKENKTKIISSSVILNNLIYCFHPYESADIFDIRMNKWNGIIKSSVPTINKTRVRSYDVTMWNEKIYGFFPDTCNKLWKTLQLNLSTNTWENLNIPLELEPNSDVWLHSL